MKAAVYNRYGPPEIVQVRDVAMPAPKDNEVLLRVHATTVSAADWRLRKADPFLVRAMNGLWRPTKVNILGMEFAGTVESTGKAVTRFAVGDRVFGSNGFRFGAHAGYLCAPEDALAIKPVNMTLEESAAVMFGGISALHFLRQSGIRAGQNVLIYGASGSVGVFAVQLAKHFGARVTGVCRTANLDLVTSLGADQVVDYTREDFSSRAHHIYDIVFDTVGKSGFKRSLNALKPGGFYVRVGSSGGMTSMLGSMLRGMWISKTGTAKVIGGVARGALEDQYFLKDLIEAGSLRTVIDRRYPLEQIAEAYRYVETGHKKGHVVIVLEPAGR